MKAKTMRQTLLILIFLFTIPSTYSQSLRTYSINGYVQDKESGERLIGCYVFDPEKSRGILTNSFGYFNITANEGNNKIATHYLGYNDQSISLIIINDTTIIIKLTPAQPFKLDEVSIISSGFEAKLSRPQTGLLNLNSKDVKRLPSFLGESDVMRAIQVLPGIQAANERSTGISVRGGSIDQNLFLLDDAPVFQISHMMGFFSVFNNDAVKDIKVYKGDIPANYGGRLSSLIDIRTKDGNLQNVAVSGGVGIICSNLSVEGPIVKNRVSFIVSGKYSYLGLLYKRIESNVDLTFYDLNCKLNAVINNNNRIYISSYNGNDNSKIGMNANYHNNTLSMRWNHIYNPKLFSNVSLIYSNYRYTTSYSTETNNNSLNYSWNSGIQQITLKAEYNYYLNSNNTIDFGASTTYKNFMPGKLEGNKTVIDNITKSEPFSNRVVDEQRVQEYAMYISNQQKITEKLSFKYGIRASLYQDMGGHWVYKLINHQVVDSVYEAKNKTYANFFSLEPRIGINYRTSNNSAIKASYSYTTQQDQLIMKTNGGGPLDVWFPSDNNIKPQKSSQYSLGYVHYMLNNLLEASIDGYYKHMTDIIDYKDGASFLESSSVYTINKTSYNFEEQLRAGNGYSYGTELMLKSDFNKLNGFISYTYARSFRKIPDINHGQTYLSPFDKPHAFDVFLNYNATKRMSISANFRCQSGQVTTIPFYVIEMWGKALSGYSNRNEYRLPSYQRLDLSLTIKNKEHPGQYYHSEWNFSITNVLNHANIQYVNFVSSKENPNIINAKGVSMLGIIPSVSYHFNF
ncbi:MAG TPA: hypothetical protein DCL77_17150 [Prolixibacteraceae bacterium]|jgi:hypothetical protein|nr:hypothetical protein [Prolixibacteraceae bacterium]